MHFLPQVANAWWFQRPLLTLPQCLNFLSLSSAKVIHCVVEEDCDDFLPWLEQKARVKISSFLSIGKSTYGWSLFASKPIQYGDCILRVPYSVQISPENTPLEITSSLDDGIGNVGKLAIVILAEQKMGQNSEWAPYITRLPRPGEMHNTIFWSNDELDMIRQSSVYHETLNLKAQIEKEYLSISPVLHQFPAIFEDIALKEFMHAYALVGSRAWGSTKGLSLIPFADFLNHDGAAETVLLSDEDKQCSEVIADQNYAPGEQVLIRYGKFSNATLLVDFGFTQSYNIHDQVQLQLDVPHDDLLCRMKLELLHGHTTPAIKDVNNCGSFTIKEVRSARGKGKGIPQSLRAFSRVLCCNSPEELSNLAMEAAQNDGRLARYPFKCKIREFQAHHTLLTCVTLLIEEYDASIKSLGVAESTSEVLNIRRQMARNLLTGELRVLKSAYAWLTNYCETLSSTNNTNQ